jgi:succinyl-CoA synthetase beta subunit
VHICETPEDAKDKASKMMGEFLVTKQTGPDGQLCKKVLINEGIIIDKEYYFAILMDRSFGGPVIVASTEGGMDIEEVAEKNPSAILKEAVPITTGLTEKQASGFAKKLGFKGDLEKAAAKQFMSLYEMFIGSDATQVEINPLAIGRVPGKGDASHVFAVDAKLNFDDNAAFRQKAIFSQRDKSMEDPRDVAAEEAGLNYIGLDGNIGCLVNGAGLAMATMDIVKLHGGNPANFLDVGGGATAEQVATAFRIITSDSNVKALLVNIFGGIMKCDTIATGIVTAAKEVGLKIPLIVRLEGTNVEMGKQILRDSGIAVTTANDLDDAAKKAVASVGRA